MLKVIAGTCVGMCLAALLTLIADNPDAPDADKPVRAWQLLLGMGTLAQAAFAAVALRSLHHGRAAVNAANETLMHQRATTEMQLRSYFDATTIKVVRAVQEEPVRILLTFKNAGATPILGGHLRYTASLDAYNGNGWDSSTFEEWVDVAVPAVLPGDEWPLNMGLLAAIDRFNYFAFTQDLLRIGISYEITYRDAFREGRRTTGKFFVQHDDDAFVIASDGKGTMT